MDYNITVLSGRLAATPEIQTSGSGTRLVRYLVTVCSDTPKRRVDVLPVIHWDPTEATIETLRHPGAGVWVSGNVQRRFWGGADGRRSRLEIIAHDIQPSQPGEAKADV